MTQEEQPPVNPENPTDSGEDLTPPTQTEEDAARVAQATEIANTQYSMADHVTYAQMIYEQPSWVVSAVFESGMLDPNQKYTPGDVTNAIGIMMQTPDGQFETGTEAP